MSDKKGKKVTIADEKAASTTKPLQASASVDPTSYASAGTASDPSIVNSGVQQGWQNTNVHRGGGSGGQGFIAPAPAPAPFTPAVDGYNPSLGQQVTNIHQTGALDPRLQPGPARGAPAACFHPNSTALAYHLGPVPLPQRPQLSRYLVNPVGQHPGLLNHAHACQPSFHPYIVRTLFVPPATIVHQHQHFYTCTMADYGNGAMPNTGQHFQPPVPDTTYGPMTHTYRPRYDAGVPAAAVGAPMFSSYQTMPCSCPYPTAPAPVPIAMPQVQNGIAAAPSAMPMMSYHQPVMIQAGQPLQAMPAMMSSSGIPALMPTAGIPQPIGGVMGGCQPPFYAGNCAPDVLPPGILPPDIMGVGRTHGENTLDLLESMHKDNLLEPQDMKPADDDPARMYMCRELDGNWTKRSRFTIDRLPCRWYVTPWGGFYAVRLED